MRKIRVAFFADILLEDFDGCIRTIQHLVNRIPDTEFEFLYLTGEPPNDKKGREYIKLTSVAIPMNSTYNVTLPFFDQSKIKKVLKAFSPDIIHISNPSLLGTFGANYAKTHNLPLTTIYHTHFISYVKYYLRYVPFLIPFTERRVTKRTKKLYEQCDIVYVPVPGILDDFKTIGIGIENCKIWPRGIDAVQFNPIKRNVNSLAKITGNNKPNILFASRLVWEKNLSTLIEIYQLAESKEVECNFIVVGDGVAYDAVKQKMPNAFFLGSMNHDELSIVYASSDIFVFPSDTETYGNVIIEAMASGIPSVAANHGGPTGIIENGVNGYLCDSHDPKAYLEKIELLLTDKPLRDKMKDEGLKYIGKLSWESLAKVYFDDLRRLFQESQSAQLS